MSNRRKRRVPYGKPISSHDKPTTGFAVIDPTYTPDGKVSMVVLDRVEPGVEPPYCTHGKTTCYACPEWCWLGCESYEAVRNGGVVGICIQCATARFTPDMRPVARLNDTLHHK